MIRKFLRSIFIILTGSVSVYAQNVTVSGANASSNGSYATLQLAFSAINSFNQAGLTITVSIVGNTTETGTATLNQNAGVWSTLSIQPSGGAARTISGTIAGPLVSFDNADNVTMDGLNSGGNSLTINNTSTSNLASTIRFVNDATYNTITNCFINGSSTGVVGFSTTEGAVVAFSNTTGTTGNDYNTVSYCDIGPSGGNLPYIGVRSIGTATKSNDYNTLNNNYIHDFFQAGAAGAQNINGIYLITYNSNWSITNNHIYQSATRTFTSGGNTPYRPIRVSTSADASSGGFTITGNIIGFQTSTGTGTTTITVSGNFAPVFEGIILEAGSSGALSTISNNTISNIDFTSARSRFSASGLTSQAFVGIYTDLCSVTISDNIIGSASGIGSIIINSRQTGLANLPCVVGILTRGSIAQTVTGNTIGGITVAKHLSATQNSMYFSAISAEGSANTTFSSNTIGNSTSNNITSDQTGANVVGINLSQTGGTVTVSSNTIQNLNHNATSANTGTNTLASVIGISASGTSGTYSLSQNTITGLTNTLSAASSMSVYGILANQSSGTHTISRNLVYGLSVSATTTNGIISGIRTLQGTITISNNMVSLGSGVTSNNPIISAMELQGGIPSLYYNSFVVTGSLASSGNNTYALNVQSTSAGYNIQNNIIYNTRGTTSTNLNRALHFAAGQLANVTTENNNDLYVGSFSTVLGSSNFTTYANLTGWQSGTGKDANSISSSVTFTNIASDLHITDCVLAGRGSAISITIDYDNSTRNTIPWIGADEPFITWNGGTGNWNAASNWTPSGIPASYQDVVISSGSVSLNADALCHSITIGTGVTVSGNIYKLTIGGTSCQNSFFVNNGTFNANTGTVEFLGANSATSGYIGGTSATTFNNVTLNTGITFPSSPQATINSSLQLNSGSFVGSNSPIYGSSSTLTYNTSGSYGIGLEWTSTTDGAAASGRPSNVTIVNTTLNMTTTDRAMAGNLTINLLGTLVLDITSGDLIIRGNWSDQGTFTPYSRAVYFTGTSDQTITRVGGGTETFPYFCINKPNAGTYVKPDNGAGNLTDITISGTAGNVLQLLNNGSLDLNGRTVTLDGNNAFSVTGYIYVNGTRTITNSQGVSNGKFEIKSTANTNQPTWFTKSVANNFGVGSLVFDNNVLVTIADGKMDFGLSAGTNITTIQGVLQINLGGSVFPNSCYYSASPASILRFANTVDYQVNAADYTWAAGALYSGLPGIPYNVEINNSGTDVTINNARAVRNNITITDGTLTLVTGTGNFNVGGNWGRSGATSAFTPNNNTVVFDGNADQTITCTANSNKETFYGVDISNNDATPQVSLSGATSIQITNQLNLTSGIVTCGTGEVYVTNNSTASIVYDPSDNTANSWVNGSLRRKITTGYYAFPVGSSISASGDGYQLAFLDFSSNTNIDNILAKFTADATTTSDETFSLVVTGTTILDRLNAGYWNFNPYDAALAFVASPTCSYDVELNERGHTNSASSPFYYAVIKRTDCVDPCATPWNQQCGTHTNATQTETGGTAHAERTGYGCSSFSDYAVGIGEFILPIQLIDFSVDYIGGNGVLSWNTASEFSTDYFGVERSLDGINFTLLGNVKAQGYSTSMRAYTFTDPEISDAGVQRIYYRLKMVDLDQSFEYSPVRWIDFTPVAAGVEVFPNPFHDELSVNIFSSDDHLVAVQLTDFSGKVISEMTATLPAGQNFILFNLPEDLAPSMYFLTIHDGSKSVIRKVVKE